MISTGPPKQQTKELILSGWGDTPHRWLFRDVFCVPKLPGQLSEPLKWNPRVSSIFFRYFGEIFWTKKLNLLRGLLYVTNSGVDIALKGLLYSFMLFFESETAKTSVCFGCIQKTRWLHIARPHPTGPASPCPVRSKKELGVNPNKSGRFNAS